MSTKTLLASVAAFGMAVAPIAVQAGTRATESTVSLAGSDRQESPVSGELDLVNRRGGKDAEEMIFWVGGLLVVIAVIIAASSGGSENDSSFGTGG